MRKHFRIRWQLVFYDLAILFAVQTLLLVVYVSNETLSPQGVTVQMLISGICIFAVRIMGNIYGQIWRYGGIQCYIRLLVVDMIAFMVNLLIEKILPIEHITFARLLAIDSINLLGALAIRMVYRYAYKCGNRETRFGRCLYALLRLFAGENIIDEKHVEIKKIKIAIIGAGRVGVGLAEELINNSASAYQPKCFVDVRKEKVGREIHGIPVISENEATFELLKDFEVQEIVFAIPHLSDAHRKRLYDSYKKAGYKIKVYDYPIMSIAGGKRHLREFDIEELLFRKPLVVSNEATKAYYKDKRILITGGGGSIGSELCRQIAKMQPKQLVLLDVYENGVYDVQQELRIAYKEKLDLQVEIVSVCNRIGLERVFKEYHPQVVIHAAAHKHVPLMEKNCIEAVQNNVFGTLNTVELSEEYNAERFIMVSTDKAVNPTNIMGATKRMCEMIVQSHGRSQTDTTFSVTRFGNVLGSAGSVIPLFKRQITNGGPITITDKRIIRYFMTIPEATQLVLQSGAMAKNGELFVLDMGKPVKILDLAENMIRLAGFEPYKDIDVVETGLRPGEKLYEELLVKTEELDRTENSLIFVERDVPIGMEKLEEKLELLRVAVRTNDDEIVRRAMKMVVPNYRSPEEVNANALEAEEMKTAQVMVG